MAKLLIFAILFLLLLLFCLLPNFDSGGFIFGFIHKNATTKCPEMPEGLKGQQKIEKIFPTMEELEEKHPEVEMGGWWKPKGCSAQQRVAIIIPYRYKMLDVQTF